MISYFVSRTAADGLPSGDIKSIYTAAKHLCVPEMRKDCVYKLMMSLNLRTFDITTAACGCPAGKGPFASCKHIEALCYAFVEFCASGSLTYFLTCTDKLQAWNKPKPKKVEPIPVEDFCRRKTEITRKQNKRQSIAEYDPYPTSVQTNNAALLENLRVSLLQSNYTSSFLQLLVAP